MDIRKAAGSRPLLRTVTNGHTIAQVHGTGVTLACSSRDNNDPDRSTPCTSPILSPRPTVQPSRRLFMPRLGVAYRPAEIGWCARVRTLLQRASVEQLHHSQPQSPEVGHQHLHQHGDGRQDHKCRESTALTYTSPFGIVNPTIATGINALDPANNQPYVTQWSLDVQRRLPFETVLSVGYVGNKGTHIDQTVELNLPLRLPSWPTPIGGVRFRRSWTDLAGRCAH